MALAMRDGKPLALGMFDVDHFARVNESLGQPGGDALLSEVANRVGGTTRSEDVFARFEGEAFALICRDVDALRASKAAYRIMDLVSGKAFEVSGQSLAMSVSLGVADLSQLHEPTAQALVEAANAALFLAKRNGRNRVEIYDPENEPTRLV